MPYSLECRQGANFSALSLQPCVGRHKSVTLGLCNTRPTVAFVANDQDCLLIGTQIIILLVDRGTCVNTMPECKITRSETHNI